jgi:hypothetical protein
MSLSADLEQVLLDNLSDNGEESIELTSFQQKKVKQMANGMSDAIINWLTQQTFTITEMKAMVEIEKLSTAGPIQTELPIVTAVAGTAGTGAPGQSIFKSLNLKKTGGQGLRTDSLGYAYIGNKAPNGETNEDKTKVQLLEEDVTER